MCSADQAHFENFNISKKIAIDSDTHFPAFSKQRKPFCLHNGTYP